MMMMTTLRLSSFLLLLLLTALPCSQASTSTRSNEPQEAATNERSTPDKNVRGASSSGNLRPPHQADRQLKNDKNANKAVGGPGNGNGNGSGSGLIEPKSCADFELAGIQDRARSSLTDTACRTNSCNNGCCRVYAFLLCDQSNAFDQLQCVCNNLTAPKPAPTPRPSTIPPPTLSPVFVSAPSTSDRGGSPADSVISDPPVATPMPAFPSPVQTPQDQTKPTSQTGTPAPVQTDTVSVQQQPTFAPQLTPQAPAPTTRAPQQTSPSPTARTSTPAPVNLAWRQCAGGSVYHQIEGGADACFYAEDCKRPSECCIKNFCLCSDPNGQSNMCVPSRFTS